MSQPTAQEVADILSQYVNGMRSDHMAELVDLMQRDHPTLVSNKGRLFLAFFEAGTDDNGDMRREALAKLSRAIADLPSEVKHIPYI